MRSSYLFTSESVSEGHPDKVADQISDAIVDLFLSKDPEARVACETMTTTNRVVLAGEIRGEGIMDEDGNWAPGIREEIEQAVRDVGEAHRLRAGRLPLGPLRLRQPPPPPVGAHRAGRRCRREQGRGRRRPGHHVRLRLRRDARPDAGDARLQPQDPRARWPRTATRGAAPFLEPDAKSQVTLRFEDGKPAKATAIVVSTQHKPGYDKGEKQAELHAYVKDVVARVHARSSCSATRPSITSTRPAASRSAAPTATPASPAARSSSTPMAARLRTAAAPSRARTRPRSTARPLMPRATSPRTSSPPASPSAARSSSLMRSASPSRCRSTSTRTAPARSATTRSRRRSAGSASSGG